MWKKNSTENIIDIGELLSEIAAVGEDNEWVLRGIRVQTLPRVRNELGRKILHLLLSIDAESFNAKIKASIFWGIMQARMEDIEGWKGSAVASWDEDILSLEIFVFAPKMTITGAGIPMEDRNTYPDDYMPARQIDWVMVDMVD